jgi:thioredoxin reductase (NADPH)
MGQGGTARDPGARWHDHRQPLLLETSQPGVFAAGDVRHGSVKRVASAMGDGAITIPLVHRYLEGLAVPERPKRGYAGE